jgi:hypothetical protein
MKSGALEKTSRPAGGRRCYRMTELSFGREIAGRFRKHQHTLAFPV